MQDPRKRAVPEAALASANEAVRRLQAASRAAHRALRTLQRHQRGDLVAALDYGPGEQPDTDLLADLVQLARVEYQQHEISIYVVAHVGMDKEVAGDRAGHGAGSAARAADGERAARAASSAA